VLPYGGFAGSNIKTLRQWIMYLQICRAANFAVYFRGSTGTHGVFICIFHQVWRYWLKK